MRKSIDEKAVSVLAYVIVIFLAIICFVPFWLIIVGSLSEEKDILRYGYSFWPKNFSMESYKMVFNIPKKIFTAYGVSTFITIIGGGVSLFLTAMTAYVIMRKDFKYRNKFAMFFYFPSIFSGGMIPGYLLITQYLNLKDNVLALILPSVLVTWNIFMMRNFMRDIPDSIMESAKLDGANDFKIFIKLYLPLSLAGLATIGLFIGLMYWNDWSRAMLYLNKPALFPLQYLLYQMLSSAQAIQEISASVGIATPDLPNETFKMAMAIVTTGPILLLYPFVQRFFVKGLTVGAVKG